jgi:hypothetical protein
MAFSAVYEIIEMVAAVIVSPELGTAYLGTQGDEWDAQKDAALAFVGAIVAMGITWSLVRRLARGSQVEFQREPLPHLREAMHPPRRGSDQDPGN